MVFKLRFDWRGRRGRFRPGRYAAAFSDLEPHEAPDRNVFPKLGDCLGDHFADGYALVLDVVLFVEAVFLVEFFHLAVDDFVDDRFRLARRQRLRLINVAFLFEHLGRHFFAPHVTRIQRRDVHGDVVRKLLERVRARHEVRLAVQLDQHADFPAGVDVAADEPFAGFPLRFLRGSSLTLLPQNLDSLLDDAVRFDQRIPTIVETCSGPLAQFFYELCWYLHGWLLCAHPFSLCCLAISCQLPLATKRPAPNRSARASRTFYPRNLFSVFRRREEQWLPQPRQAPPAFPQRPRRSRLPVSHTVRTRSY